MSNFLCKTLIRVRHLLAIPPYTNLRCVQSLHFNSATAADSASNSFTVSYLIDSCSFSPESALSASKYVSFDSPQKPDSVISFFKNHGFSDAQISILIGKYPRVLLCDPNKTLLPKLEFFYSQGASSLEVPEIIVRAPEILKRSVNKHLLPTFDFFKGYFQTSERTIASIKRLPRMLSDFRRNQLIDSTRMLLDAGVPEANISLFLLWKPRMFSMNVNRMTRILECVMRMGFDPSKWSFIHAVYAMDSMSKSTWEQKLEAYKRWGLSEKEILAAFRRQPWCMTYSEEKIMSGMDFFVNKLGWESAAVVKKPVLLSFSLKKRIIPRASVLLHLFEKGLIKKDFMLVQPYMCTEPQFLQKFVDPHVEKVPQLSKLYHVNVDEGIH